MAFYLIKDTEKRILAKTTTELADTAHDAGATRDVAGKLNIIFTNAVPSNFENGQATQCYFIANIHNNSKYHFGKISFKIDTFTFNIDGINANSSIDDTIIGQVALVDTTEPCAFQADYIRTSVGDAGVLDCSIPSVAEGDCQQLVSVSTSLTPTKISTLLAIESGSNKSMRHHYAPLSS